jgi:GTP cyclohydrolase I
LKRNYEATESVTTVKNIFNSEDEKMVEHLIRKMLGLSKDVELDDNLKETPHRVCKMWTEMTEGYRVDPKSFLDKVFPVNSPNMADDDENKTFDESITAAKYSSGLVCVSTDAWSCCVHHLAPMHGRVSVVYCPGKKVVGLSKIVRMVKMFGRRLNLQEGWQDNIADAMMEKLGAQGVAVRMDKFVHSCVSLRGAAEQTSRTTTSCVRGIFADNAAAREEAFALMDKNSA